MTLVLLLFISLLSCNANKNSTKKSKQEQSLINDMDALIFILKADYKLHKKLGNTVTDEDISITETKLGIKLPASYKQFVKELGNGAQWLYHVDQPINGVNKEYGKVHWLNRDSTEKIESDGFGTFEKKQLLYLMTENSNGGAWVWLTTDNASSHEWPLAYLHNGKLYYKLENFIEWLTIATESKEEVIRQVDVEHRLGLG